MIARVHRTKRPLVLTLNGRSRAVVLDVEEFERLTYERDLFRAMTQGEIEIEKGHGIEHETAMKHLLRKYSKR